MNLVLFETSGNQPFIFDTNKQRENVGASQLTYWAGTEAVLKAVVGEGGPALWHDDPGTLRSWLTDPKRNKPIETSSGSVEVVLATSGKALLLVNSKELGLKIIRRVTEAASREAPGLDMCGAVGDSFGLTDLSIEQASEDVYRLHERLGSRLPSPGARFARMPIFDECATSGLPASCLERARPEDPWQPRSVVSQYKRKASGRGWQRMQQIVKPHGLELYPNLDEMEKDFEGLDWSAVIHADGNGVGGIFLDFGRYSKAKNGREYVDRLRNFSIGLEICAERAFVEALRRLDARLQKSGRKSDGRRRPKKRYLPVIPLVLGGDDFTVLSAGRYAPDLAHDYVVCFEEETEDRNGPFNGIVRRIAEAASGIGRLSACAGVAIIKPHYPFHAAYELAEGLIASAKKVKQPYENEVENSSESAGVYPLSAIDFLIHHDSSGSDLEGIRKRLVVDHGSTDLFRLPFVVTDLAKNGANPPEERVLKWAEGRHWSRLVAQVAAIQAVDEDGRRKLPRSMLHDLREGLFHGRKAADAGFGLVIERYRGKGLGELALKENDETWSLFELEQRNDGKSCWVTRFLDALDASEFITP